MYKAIIFDLGKVIIPFDFGRGYRALEPLCAYSAAQIPERIRPTGLVAEFETGLLEPEDFVRKLSEHLELNIDHAGFCQIWSSIFLPETLVPESLIAGLRRRYRLLLLSNTNIIHFEMVRENYPILRHFHDYVLSYEVKAMKPAPVIYERAVELAGCAAAECLFIDDLPENVEGAKVAGLDAVLFTSSEQLEADFAARAIRWD